MPGTSRFKSSVMAAVPSFTYGIDCSIQRRHQKLIEVAPAPDLPTALRAALHNDAVRLAQELSYRSLGTFEFLVALDSGSEQYYFMEANPRLQVEHTVTEEVLGLDLVQLQLRLALSGCTLEELGMQQADVPEPVVSSIQLRVNLETTTSEDGTPIPSSGTIKIFEPPSGRGFRTDTAANSGYQVNPRFDSLLAKLVVRGDSGGYSEAHGKAILAHSPNSVSKASRPTPAFSTTS